VSKATPSTPSASHVLRLSRRPSCSIRRPRPVGHLKVGQQVTRGTTAALLENSFRIIHCLSERRNYQDLLGTVSLIDQSRRHCPVPEFRRRKRNLSSASTETSSAYSIITIECIRYLLTVASGVCAGRAVKRCQCRLT
jgi:hypothetical protein